MYITNTTNEFTMGSSHVVFLNIFFYGDVTQKRHWQKNLPVGFNGLICFITGLNHSYWECVFKHKDLEIIGHKLNKNMSNFDPLQVVDRDSETQLQVDENLFRYLSAD